MTLSLSIPTGSFIIYPLSHGLHIWDYLPNRLELYILPQPSFTFTIDLEVTIKPLFHSGSHALGLGPNMVSQTLTLNCWQEQRRTSG